MTGPILALHVGHNASACIGDQNGLIFAIQEERLNGEKNYWGFPERSIRACLAAANVQASDLSKVVVGTTFVLHRYHSREDVVESYDRQRGALGWLRTNVAIPIAVAAMRDHGQEPVRADLARIGLGSVPVEFLDHHRTHAATAYYGLRSDPRAPHLVLTCDGAGDRVSASVRVWAGESEKVISTTADVDSLGAIYALTTHAMGFVPMEHEYKLMGMAPYSAPKHAEEHAKLFEAYLGLSADGLAFKRRTRQPTYALLSRILRDINGRRFDNVCAGLQWFTEKLLVQWVKNAVAATGIRRVVAAGGVFMNVKANKAIAALPEVDSFEAYPSCGDETLAMGAFYLAAARAWGDASVGRLEHFYLGDDLDPKETEASLAKAGLPYEKPADLPTRIAELLVAGEPVARCAGRMEFGARALCNRSILADPSNQDVVRVINQMVKKRDFWMPFAPVVKSERQSDYIVNPKGLRSPYMMMTFDTTPRFRELIAAVHNADLTCRAQILERGQNPGVEAIMDAFEKKTGRAVLLNTSFNLHGFPIVRTAQEALDVLVGSGLRNLVVGDYLVRKPAGA
ncbi:MAG: carbamoyltransferase C-terminal domain-containing protein [Sandaracinus sp.]